ncbi:hypothetical protein BAUCODRAFT_76931 [Baudoinia panamericana UAMH 10762]|uniref:Phosphoacetylglucosamine mutase n=1 Tax=Baudoinia panamericana (strain UAMH 10762) TaxID=717646 RepID=M2N0Z7_BAUPA|nr:uncharacterized protein BAUCODRAFT_76931 [Baudoinia panamericana UAMH 10762]EMC92579.1 hypothetical protein BAUCODRAFT_76931 [Baudoinia panamericana UAMH 10762]
MAYNAEEAEFVAIEKAAASFPRQLPDRDFTYGTAGFRMRADLLPSIMFTVGLLASLRSKKCNGNTIGVMITASHNPAEDNGVKLVDPMGDMLNVDWEWYAAGLANARDPEKLRNGYMHCINKLKVDRSAPSKVIFARDTRPSGATLVKALTAALDAVKTPYIDYGYATTPQLHYLVRATNTVNSQYPYGEVSEEGYYKKLAEAFNRAMEFAKPNGAVTVDCANGVGAPKLKELIKHLPKDKLTINIINDQIENPDKLNNRAGADWVKTQQRGFEGFDGKPLDRYCALDGDADRLVYFFNEEGKVFRLLDGDRIATLAASFIGDLVRKAGLDNDITLKVVQTAYANGAATKYVEQVLKLKVECTPTGVKHLHHVAAQADIGVYFEANGHGTVLFSERALKTIRKHDPQSPAQLTALDTLKALCDLINQTVGDALSDLLLVEVVLAHKEWTVADWLGTYKEFPNKLGKVNVRDRGMYQTVPGTAERRLQSPPQVQIELDNIVKKYRDGRCFVRASGTEDAVRVYGEAAEAYDVDDMVGSVMSVISNLSGQMIEPVSEGEKSADVPPATTTTTSV